MIRYFKALFAIKSAAPAQPKKAPAAPVAAPAAKKIAAAGKQKRGRQRKLPPGAIRLDPDQSIFSQLRR